MEITKEKWISIAKIIITALLVIAGVLGYDLGIVEPRTLALVRAVQPSPVIAQPPASAPVVSDAQAVEGRSVVISTTSRIEADKYTKFINWHRGSNPYALADLYYVIDQELGDTLQNTTTLKLQTSYDASTWFDYVGKADPGMTDGSNAIVSANVADAAASVTVDVQWPYMRLFWDVTNTSPLTVSARLYLR